MKNLICGLIIIMAGCVYAQFTVSVDAQKNEISPSFSGEFHYGKYYFMEVKALATTVIFNDRYNPKTVNVSIFSLMEVIASIPVFVFAGEGQAFSDSSAGSKFGRGVARGLIYALFMTNSRHHFNIYSDTSSFAKGPEFSLFFGPQTDYFPFKKGWARVMLKGGMEIFLPFEKGTVKGQFYRKGLAFQIGVSKGWDFISNTTKDSELYGFAGLKYLFN